MANDSAATLYRAAIAAGFPPDKAQTLTQIELAESGGNVRAVGDVGLENSTWGPSYGAPQIRTLKAQTGSGSDRDINFLSGGLAAQDKAAFDISKGGTDFSPWSTYGNGAYQRFASTVSAAVGSSGAGSGSVQPVKGGGGGGPFPTFGPSWLPWNFPSDAGNAAAGAVSGSVLSGARGIVLEGVAALAALALIGLGAYRLAAPKIHENEAEARRVIGAVL